MTEEKQDDILHILKDEKILVAAWMLPNEGSLSDAQRRQAMDNFARYTRAHGLTATHVAHQLGKPRATTIGELMKGVYRANADDHIRRLNLWVEQNARSRSAALADTFVSTKVARDMLTVARLCRENVSIALVYGPTGIGKTRCAMAIHDKYVGSIYLRVMTGFASPKGLTMILSDRLGVRGRPGRQERVPQTQLERIIDLLRNSDRLLIVDEATKLSDSAMEILRDIHDECCIPILLIATRHLHERIQRNADPDGGQFYSRVDVVKNLTEGHDLYRGDKRPLYTVDDIKKLYNEPPIRLAPDAAHYLRDVANALGYGSLRTCKILLQNAARRARKRLDRAEGEQVTVAAVDVQWVESRLKQESSEQQLIKERQRVAAGVSSG